ncbi:MAG: AcrR family transcriptional regulator [Myxococcota bacterium]|jgi:AcrR family transcriptional regulator
MSDDIPDPVEETPPEPKWRRRKKARPEELVAAALALFAEQGFAATRMRDVAKRAGVSKGTVYLYFQSKEDLLRAAVRGSIVPILDIGDDLELDSDASATDLLKRLLADWVGEFDRRGVTGVPRLVMAEAGNFPEIAEEYVNAVIQRSRRLFARVLKRGVRAGEFREIDVRTAVDVLLAPVLYGQIHRASLGTWDPDAFGPDFLDAHLQFFLRSIQRQPDA